MKKSFYLLILTMITVAGGCKKSNNRGVNSFTVLHPQFMLPTIPAGAAGAFYAEGILLVPSDTIIANARAWFLDQDSSKNAGLVTCKGDSLAIGGEPATYEVYWPQHLVFAGNNSVQWTVQGNDSIGISGFTYTDNTPFPSVNQLDTLLPINVNQSLTINYSVSASADSVIIRVVGPNNGILASASSTSSTITFPSSLVQSLSTIPGSSIRVEIDAVKSTTQTVNGQTYYFVKMNGVQRFAMVQ